MSSYRLEPRAFVALLLSSCTLTLAAGCGEETGGGATGSGGDAAASTAAVIVGPGSTSGVAGGPDDAATGGGDGGAGGGGVGGGGSADAGGGVGPTGGDGDGDGGAAADPCPDFASEVTHVEYGPGAGWGQEYFPDVVLGGPHGAGDMSGSLHVLALGNGGSITLAFAERRIVDGDGPDFVVFENAFFAGGDPARPFAELGTVEVSADGETWLAFPCTSLDAPYGSCAGWRPVYADVSSNAIDPLDPEVAGGDAFDLADVGLAEARFVRIVDRADQDGAAGVFDLDAVAIVHGTCDAE